MTMQGTIFAAGRATLVLKLHMAFAACLLGGCTSLLPAGRPALVTSLTNVSPLEYYAWARTAPENELRVELYDLELAVSVTDPVISAVRRSIILSSSGLADTSTRRQAMALLRDVEKAPQEADSQSQAYRIFGDVLLSMQQQREDLRASANATERALREIDALKSRNTELQQQIEDITSIERQIIERERLNLRDP